MTPDNPFLPALLADPDDDTLRLALADWLDENGRPARAEFIRVQIALSRGAADSDSRWYLDHRQRGLLAAHDTEWVAPLAEVLGLRVEEWSGWAFRRGFVEYVRLPASALTSYGWRLARLTPIRELHVDGDAFANLRDLWRQPWLRSVTHLSGVELNWSNAPAILDSPYLTGLRVFQSRWSHLEKSLRRQLVLRFGHALPPE